ncbi:hypothetical protein EDD22DRAFT_1051599 [Suillus occidentalis]|nr:hypothetical protein EDD22DRAFT_1051599 [Suillus occidentalis]
MHIEVHYFSDRCSAQHRYRVCYSFQSSSRTGFYAYAYDSSYLFFFEFGDWDQCAPMCIVFFRDDLSEGEHEITRKEAIGDIMDAIDNIWRDRDLKSVKPELTFIVVGKWHPCWQLPLYRYSTVTSWILSRLSSSKHLKSTIKPFQNFITVISTIHACYTGTLTIFARVISIIKRTTFGVPDQSY